MKTLLEVIMKHLGKSVHGKNEILSSVEMMQKGRQLHDHFIGDVIVEGVQRVMAVFHLGKAPLKAKNELKYS